MFKNPATSAMPYLNQIPGMVGSHLNPYWQAGVTTLPAWQTTAGSLVSDPGKFLNDIAKGYQQSPGFDFLQKQGQQAISHQQAAGGMAGTPQSQQLGAQMAENIASQDFNNWMQQALGLFGTGYGGQRDITNLGYNASRDMSGLLASNAQNQANLAYAGQSNKNQDWGNLLGGGIGIIGSLLSKFL